MSTFALAEALAITGDSRLKPAVRRAVEYSLRAQHSASGGWRYRPGQEGDTSQLGWQLMALHSAELGGVYIPPTTWTRADRFLRSVARGDHGGLAAYTRKANASRTMTAEALYCRQLLAKSIGGDLEQAATTEATEHLLAEQPGDSQFNLYYWYYAALALHPRQDESWDRWNAAMQKALVETQEQKGRLAGSWSPDTRWGGYGGRVYTTAMATLCLEVYYRYLPTFEATTE